jgi:DNA-binding NarL/FixJ family response regulator
VVEMQTAVIISDSISVCKSLIVMLNLSVNFKVLDTANNQELGLMMVKENRPGLLFINLPLQFESMANFMINVKSESPSTKCIVIVDSLDGYYDALKSGADEILQKGFTIAKLNQVSQKLF